MNFFCWVKPPAGDADAIERLGNPGWNWNDFMKYSQLTEKYVFSYQRELFLILTLHFDKVPCSCRRALGRVPTYF